MLLSAEEPDILVLRPIPALRQRGRPAVATLAAARAGATVTTVTTDRDDRDFDAFIDRAWDRHADEPAAVAHDLQTRGPALAATEAQLSRLALLLNHVHGTHLGSLVEGRAVLEGLTAHPACGDGARAELRRGIASLRLCAGESAELEGYPVSDRIRITAMAAAHLAERETPRAAAQLRQALDEAETAALPTSDPMHRALAITANNLACTLEEKPARSSDERALMIAAAEAARRHWALAGTWLETERAEYRLAMTWLQAGEPAQALQHARACLEIVRAHDAPALERFFAFEALGVAERAAGEGAGHARAVAGAEAAFAELSNGDRAWCRSSLDKLRA